MCFYEFYNIWKRGQFFFSVGVFFGRNASGRIALKGELRCEELPGDELSWRGLKINSHLRDSFFIYWSRRRIFSFLPFFKFDSVDFVFLVLAAFWTLEFWYSAIWIFFGIENWDIFFLLELYYRKTVSVCMRVRVFVIMCLYLCVYVCRRKKNFLKKLIFVAFYWTLFWNNFWT